MCAPSLSLKLVINSDNSYKRNDKDKDSVSEIDKREISFNTIDNEDFLLLLKPVSISVLSRLGIRAAHDIIS